MMNLQEVLDTLKDKGYTANLKVENKNLLAEQTNMSIEHCQIDQVFRIESDSDPTHQTVVYGISCSSPEVKGVVVNSYGVYSDSEKDSVIEKIEAQSQ